MVRLQKMLIDFFGIQRPAHRLRRIDGRDAGAGVGCRLPRFRGQRHPDRRHHAPQRPADRLQRSGTPGHHGRPRLCVASPPPHCLKLQKLYLLPLPSLAQIPISDPNPSPCYSSKRRNTVPRTKQAVSHKQLAANRANAAQSTGPRSPEGKARSALNSRKHGFTASTFAVVRLEDIDEVAKLRDDAIAVYQPVNSQELFAIAQQVLLRVERLHEGICTTFLNEALTGDGKPLMEIGDALVNGDHEITMAQNRNYLFAEGFHRINKYSPSSFTLFLRYQAQSERMYRRAVEEFERLKRLRRELPNEAILEAQPEPNETTCPTPQTKPSPAAKLPGQPPRFHPNGEPFLVPPRALPPDQPETPSPDPDQAPPTK